MLPNWVTKKPIVSDVEYMSTYTMKHNNRNRRWCIYCNNGNGAWGFHWKVVHKEWKEK